MRADLTTRRGWRRNCSGTPFILAGAVVSAGCVRTTATEPSSTPEPSSLPESSSPPEPSLSAPLPATAADCEPEMFPSEAPAQGPVGFEADDGLFGFKDAQGRVLIPAQFQFAYEFFEQGLSAAVLANQFVFINRQGEVLARAFAYDNGPDYFSEGRARIVRDGKIGFIDKGGTIVVEPRFDFAGPFCQGRAPVCEGCQRVEHGEYASYEGGRWGQIDFSGRLLGELITPDPK